MSELRTKMVAELAAAKASFVDLLQLAQVRKNEYEACKKVTAPRSAERRAVYNVWYEVAKEQVPAAEREIAMHEARIEFFDAIYAEALGTVPAILKRIGVAQTKIKDFEKAVTPKSTAVEPAAEQAEATS